MPFLRIGQQVSGRASIQMPEANFVAPIPGQSARHRSTGQTAEEQQSARYLCETRPLLRIETCLKHTGDSAIQQEGRKCTPGIEPRSRKDKHLTEPLIKA